MAISGILRTVIEYISPRIEIKDASWALRFLHPIRFDIAHTLWQQTLDYTTTVTAACDPFTNKPPTI
ncbi:hypothetical protein Hte_004961 [Hypoxylon texense]